MLKTRSWHRLAPPKAVGEGLRLLGLSPIPGFPSLTRVTPISASAATRPPHLCVCLFSSHEDTSRVGLGPTYSDVTSSHQCSDAGNDLISR